MEELYHIHKDMPFGYWTEWVEPAARFVARKWRERKARIAAHKPAEPSLQWKLLRWG